MPAEGEVGLARALSDLSIALHRTGEIGEGMDILLESLAIYHRVAQADPGGYLLPYAQMLFELAGRRLMGRQPGDADAPLGEALDLAVRIAAADPAGYERYLAGHLHNHASWERVTAMSSVPGPGGIQVSAGVGTPEANRSGDSVIRAEGANGARTNSARRGTASAARAAGAKAAGGPSVSERRGGLLRLGRHNPDEQSADALPQVKLVRQQPVRQARGKRSGKR